MHSTEESYSIMRQNRNLRLLFLFLFAAVIGSLVFLFRSYVWIFLMTMIFYMALVPLHEWVHRYIKNRSLSSLIIVFAVIVLIVVPLMFLLIALMDQTYQLYLFIQEKISFGLVEEVQKSRFLQEALTYLGLDQQELIRKATESLQKLSFDIVKGITAVVYYPVRMLVKFFFMILMLYFLLKDGHRLAGTFYRVLPFPDDIEQDVVERLTQVVKILFAGNFFIMLLQGLMVGLALAFFGFSMPLLWGSIASVLSLIPVVGTTFIWVPASMYLVAQGGYISALVLGAWCLFWYFLLENLVKPLVMGDRLRFHPLLFFFLLLGSIQSLGLPGVIIGPMLLSLFYSLWEIYNLVNSYNMQSAGANDKEKHEDDTSQSE